ncbi:hypothetical protein [Trinickia mobilis]|uniref:hypothetical protein n=1 Tax=Trinickia mobilis TaxID=2816356 RepID=UPI001A8F35A7|nr:hypothetical protein [Trinickia mobilis]
MEFKYRGWVIDPTPDFSLGRFFAHARLIRASTDNDDGADAEMHIERNLSWFDNEDEAVQVAHEWSIEWIDARECNIANPDTGSTIQTKTLVK